MENSKKKNGNKNPYIESMNEDVLYHIGLSSGSQDLKAMFGDIKVCIFRHSGLIFQSEFLSHYSKAFHFVEK